MYLVLGEPGTGKTLLGMTFLKEGLANGEDVLFIHGEEAKKDMLLNGAAVGIDLDSAEDELLLEDIDHRGTELVAVDGTEGYQLSLQGDQGDVIRSLHALSRHLTARNVTVVVIDQSDQSAGLRTPTQKNFSYLVGNVVALNDIEREGHKERIASVMKKRIGDHEETARPYTLRKDGVEMREPERATEGFLT
jgi:circadian clock protein KaiC